jgi:MFS family permease
MPAMLGRLTTPTARGLANLYTGTLASGVGWAMVVPTLVLVSEVYGVSEGTAAQIVTAYALGKFLGIPGAGFFIDRFGTRKLLVGGPALMAVGALGAAATPWFAPVLGAMLIVGVGDSLWALGREVAGIDLVQTGQRGRALAAFHGTHSGGLAIGPLAGGLLADTLGLRAVFLAFAIVTGAAVALGLVAHDARARHGAPAPDAPPARRGLSGRWAALRALFAQVPPGLRLNYWVLVYATVAGFVFRITLQSILPLFAGERLDLTATQVGGLFSISGVLVFAMILPAGFVLDKAGRKWATVPSTLLPGLAFLLVPLTTTYAQLAVLVGFMGIANGLSLGSLAASTYDILPQAVRGRLQAFRRTTAEVGGVTAPLLGGVLTDAYGPGTAFWVYGPFIALGGLALWVVARETLTRT